MMWKRWQLGLYKFSDFHFLFQLYDIPRAKDDFKERTDKAIAIKGNIEKTFKDVCDANDVLQVN